MTLAIELGDRVRDRISGLVGIATAVTHYIYGCTRWTLTPEICKEGAPAEVQWFDEPQLEVVERGIIKPLQLRTVETGPAGPRPDARRAADTPR